MQGSWAESMVEELRYHIPRGAGKKRNISKDLKHPKENRIKQKKD